MPELPPGFLEDLAKIVGPAHCKSEAIATTIDPGGNPANLDAGVLVAPATTEEVAAVVQLCRVHRVPIVSHGGRTGLVDGAVSRPGEIILSTSRLDRIVRMCASERVAVVEAGVTLQALQVAAAELGLEPGIDLPSRGSATVGGMVSTNAGGISAFRHGVMRHRIFGMEAVLPDGSIYRDLTRVVKNAAGYDLKHLFIGSEGTLGIVTRIAIKLEPLPATTATMLFGLPDVATVLKVISRCLNAGYGTLRAAEAMWATYFQLAATHHRWSAPDFRNDHPVYLLVSFGGNDAGRLQEECEAIYCDIAAEHGEISAVIATSLAREQDLWRLREDTDVIYRKHPGAPSHDISIPLSELDAYLARCLPALKRLDPNLAPYVFGHLADGNLHIAINACGNDVAAERINRIDDILYADLAAAGGAFSAEHGIGSKRIAPLAATADATKLSLMRLIKRTLDPDNILNPGKVLRREAGDQ